jgi:predicted amidohydrolase
MKVNIAAVMPHTHAGADEETVNLERAAQYLKEAAGKGADIVCFPESYPGPWKDTNLYPVKEAVSRMAADCGVYVICGDLEKAEDRTGYYIVCRLFDRAGKEIGVYRRTTPEGPWVYRGGAWEFDYVTGNELPVFDTEFGKIGILICSEIFVPELARALALQGAEILFYPTGVAGENFFETWGTLAKARAYENLAATVVVKNIYGSEAGFCKITGPEGVLLDAKEPGVHLAAVDLDRIRWLRASKDEYHAVPPYAVKPGLLTQWREKKDLFLKYLK